MKKLSLGARRTSIGVTLISAALLTLGAAAIHFVVAPPHFHEDAPSGAFFLMVASAQVILAIQLLTRPTRRLALLMAIGSTGLVGLWYVSRTVGLPIGPHPGTPEEMGLADVVCNVLESVSILLLLAIALRPPRRRIRCLWRIALGTTPAALLIAAMTASALAAELTPMPEAYNAAPSGNMSVADLRAPSGSQRVDQFTLTAQVTQVNGQTMWTYNGRVPGPELRVREGDRVRVTLVNELPESTTLHWHGVRIPNAEDGVAGLTQDSVQPGESYTYDFIANEAGTFWYHSHQQTSSQLPRGLFGALVVEPATGRTAEDRDYSVVLHGVPGHVQINGSYGDVRMDASAGETVRLRLINAVVAGMDGGPETPVLSGADVKVVALDGRDLNAPSPLGPTRIPLGMGQRADLVFTMPPTGAVQLRLAEVQGETSPVQNAFGLLFPDSTPASATLWLGVGTVARAPDPTKLPLFDLTRYGAPSASPVAGPFDVNQTIVLGERPGFRDGRPQLVHTLNGEASPNVTPLEVSYGQVVHLQFVNATDEFHPMHLHGHVFTVLARDGVPVTGSPVQLDSILVGPRESWDLAFVADNAGIWMLHCHVLMHAEMGMMMTINYSGVYTPFEMGTRSGNMPE
ncbi:MAG: multicopper oxidase family protein [Chloroflexi bacterium]|nr:multicopper oxidase family protein [Chloroflexota bacterium]